MLSRSRPLLIVAACLAASGFALVVAVVAMAPRRTAVADSVAATRTSAINARAVVPAAAPAFGLLDGMPMTEGERRLRAGVPPVAVMVDNWLEARPQIGLDRAELVYEALVEYGITRFMAVYWRTDAPRIEPVRSARTQFLGAALELGAVYAHVGSAADPGRADAETQMREWGVRSVDEVAGVTAITRDPTRVAPHNALTSTDALRALARERGWGAPKTLVTWPFKADGGTAGTPARSVAMDFDITGAHNGAFAVRWQYDATTNSYRRFQGGAPHVDRLSGAQLTARNVIVQLATVRPVGDAAGHVLYDTEGSGRALVLTDGRAVEATWRKDGRTGRTRYLDAAGDEIPLNRGATWVEMLPVGQPLTVS